MSHHRGNHSAAIHQPGRFVPEWIRLRWSVVASRSGGSGRVFEAVDLLTGDNVALKLMQDPSAPREHERFTRESETLAGLRHPGIVRYVAHGQTDTGEGYLAMEWLDGEDLRQRMEERGLSVSETMLLARQVADALAAAHKLGVIHRDLKPSNLFLVGGDVGNLKIIDFGVARRSARLQALTQTGAQVGTPQYICLLYTSDAADERSSVDLGGRRIIKKKKKKEIKT